MAAADDWEHVFLEYLLLPAYCCHLAERVLIQTLCTIPALINDEAKGVRVWCGDAQQRAFLF